MMLYNEAVNNRQSFVQASSTYRYAFPRLPKSSTKSFAGNSSTQKWTKFSHFNSHPLTQIFCAFLIFSLYSSHFVSVTAWGFYGSKVHDVSASKFSFHGWNRWSPTSSIRWISVRLRNARAPVFSRLSPQWAGNFYLTSGSLLLTFTMAVQFYFLNICATV